jgi:hypothetical protein
VKNYKINKEIREIIREVFLNEISKGELYAYHGSNHLINKFSDEFVGAEEATDQQGPGIYFTTSKDDAQGYGEYLYAVKLNGKKFLDDKSSSDKTNKSHLLKMIKMSENWKEKAQNYDYNPEVGARIAINGAIEYNDTEKDAFLQIWIDFYRYETIDFVRNMVKLGYDGLIVDAYGGYSDDDKKHIIVYNTNIIENLETTKKDG